MKSNDISVEANLLAKKARMRNEKMMQEHPDLANNVKTCSHVVAKRG